MLKFIAVSHLVSNGSSTGFWSSSFGTIAILAIATILAAVILGAGKAVMGLVRTRQTKRREDEADQVRLSEFLFGIPYDPRTKVPAREGWASRVDHTLEKLTEGLTEVLAEIKPDRNGRHNLRGIVERGAEAAGAELPPECRRDDDR